MPFPALDPDGSIFREILGEVANGSSLTAACKKDGRPSVYSFHEWIKADAEKAKAYARAIDDRADHLAEKVIEIGVQAQAGKIDPNAARVAIDAFKWAAGKMNQAKWGDAVKGATVNVAVAVGGLSEERRAELMTKRKLAIEGSRVETLEVSTVEVTQE